MMQGWVVRLLVMLMNLKLYLKHELDEFKGSFKQDELKENQFN
jgi:hypothetical protein